MDQSLFVLTTKVKLSLCGQTATVWTALIFLRICQPFTSVLMFSTVWNNHIAFFSGSVLKELEKELL